MSTYTNMTAEQAIERSISHFSIVKLEYDANTAAELRSLCDDTVRGNEVTEYWGTKDGSEWRVHMGMRYPVGSRVESVGGGEDDERGYVRANLSGGMVEVGWDQGSVSTMHGSALRLV